MTDAQWEVLIRVIRGEAGTPLAEEGDRHHLPERPGGCFAQMVPVPFSLPVGLIIDSPWLPGWAGTSILDYFTDERTWLEANLRVVKRFPDVLFLPGFSSEFGMCTEPSAFGVKCVWYDNAFHSVERLLGDCSEVSRLKKPDCQTDGLAPFVLKRLEHSRPAIEAAGHRIRFAVARGPLNVASYLLGHTDFLIGVKTSPDEIHRLLRVVTDYLVDWIRLQKETFDTVDGVFLLDDLIGFLRDDDFCQFALPYLTEIFNCVDVSVRFLHNDAPGLITASHLSEMGVNLFNFSFNHSLQEIRQRAGDSVVLLGNIPPRDVLAQGSPDDVRRCVAAMLAPVADRRRIIVSCGGGVPPAVSTENLEALCQAASAG